MTARWRWVSHRPRKRSRQRRRVPRISLTSAPGLSYFEECADAILRFDAEGRVVYANPAIERATAVSRWRFIGQRLEDVEHFVDFAPLWNSSLVAVLETHEGRWFKFSYPHPTGTKLFDVRMQLESGVEPAHTHVTAVLRDITVPKSALRATRAAADFVEDLLASAMIGIAVLDRAAVYRVWNEHLETLLGVPANSVLGRAFDEAPGLVGAGWTRSRVATSGQCGGANSDRGRGAFA